MFRVEGADSPVRLWWHPVRPGLGARVGLRNAAQPGSPRFWLVRSVDESPPYTHRSGERMVLRATTPELVE